MKKKLIWISTSLATLTALANGGSILDQNFTPISNKSNYKKILHAARVVVNADGSAHIINSEGAITYINPETLDLIKKVNPGDFASLAGSVPCVGKAK